MANQKIDFRISTANEVGLGHSDIWEWLFNYITGATVFERLINLVYKLTT